MAAVEPIHADLVICRLAQAASPAGEGDAPLRGAALGQVDVLEGERLDRRAVRRDRRRSGTASTCARSSS